jgi:hypothetical protein
MPRSQSFVPPFPGCLWLEQAGPSPAPPCHVSSHAAWMMSNHRRGRPAVALILPQRKKPSCFSSPYSALCRRSDKSSRRVTEACIFSVLLLQETVPADMPLLPCRCRERLQTLSCTGQTSRQSIAGDDLKQVKGEFHFPSVNFRPRQVGNKRPEMVPELGRRCCNGALGQSAARDALETQPSDSAPFRSRSSAVPR